MADFLLWEECEPNTIFVFPASLQANVFILSCFVVHVGTACAFSSHKALSLCNEKENI
jgi:hypothetical protein